MVRPHRHLPINAGRFASWLLLLVSINVGLIRAAEPYVPQLIDPLTESWRWTKFPELNGRGLRCFQEGDDGAIWFGVDQGAVRYDGLSWQEFGVEQGLADAVISFASSDGVLYAATHSSIYSYDGAQWTKTFPKSDAWYWRFEDLSPSSSGGLWAASNWGALNLQNGRDTAAASNGFSATLYTTAEVVREFASSGISDEIETGAVTTARWEPWEAGIGVHIYTSELDRPIIIGMAERGPARQAGLRVGDQIVSFNGAAWSNAFRRELSNEPGTPLTIEVLRGGSTKPLEFSLTCRDLNGSYPSFLPYSIVEDHSGTVWFGTADGKLVSMTQTADGQQQWTDHSKLHKLARVVMPRIAVTPDGVAAVGLKYSDGHVLKYDGKQWTTNEIKHAPNSSVTSIGDDRLLVGTYGGVIAINAQRRSRTPMREYGIYGNPMLTMQTSDGAIWAAGINGIAVKNDPQGDRWTSYEGIIYRTSGIDGSEWFVSVDHTVVRRLGDQWTEYGPDDGLMNVATNLIATDAGDVWATGSHQGVAATARLGDGNWELKLHPKLSWTIGAQSAMEDREGRVWFGASRISPEDNVHLGGAVRFDGTQWDHLIPPTGPKAVRRMVQSPDGSVWIGGPLNHVLPNDTFGSVAKIVPSIAGDYMPQACDRNGTIWLATGFQGIFSLDASEDYRVSHHTASSGLSNDRIRNILPLPDGTVLANTYERFDRFDGKSWNNSSIPRVLTNAVEYGALRVSRDGSIWMGNFQQGSLRYKNLSKDSVVRSSPRDFWTAKYRPDKHAPDTRIDGDFSEVLEGEETKVSWTGIDPWNVTPQDSLTYSWRVDDDEWSPYTNETVASLTNLPAGNHRFEVRARDTDFNVDASPASREFQIVPPAWKTAWFQLLMLLGGALFLCALVQTTRVVLREASLRSANQQLTEAEQRLQLANAELEARVKQRTEQLHASEVRYRSIVEDQSEYVVRFDSQRNLEFANQAFMRANGVQPQEPERAGERYELPAEAHARARQCIEGLDQKRQTNSCNLRIDHPDASSQWEEWFGRALFNDNEQLVGFQAVGRNITEQRETESRLHEKEKQLAHFARVSALGEMVAGISHEINQPLASIANFSTASLCVLDQGVKLDEVRQNLREWATRISEQTQRINKIIKGLRRFGRPGSNREAFHLDEAIAEALVMTESRTRHAVDQIDNDCPADLPIIHADRVQIEQVLVNLIRNACDSMESIPIGQRKLGIDATMRDRFVVITVTDSGPGILTQQADGLFDAFETTKTDGMGIGLAISRSIIEAHGGVIRALTDKDFGQFEFSLPVEFEMEGQNE